MKKYMFPALLAVSFAALSVLGACGGGASANGDDANDTIVKTISDKEALVKIYTDMNGANWKDSEKENWNSEAPLADWSNVKTDEAGNVTELSLTDDNFVGAMPEELAQLTHLQKLTFYVTSTDAARTTLPASLWKMRSLKQLRITVSNKDTNPAEVELPAIINMPELEMLTIKSLTSCIKGTLEGVCKLENLKSLFLGGYAGEMTDKLAELPNLESITISYVDGGTSVIPNLSTSKSLKRIDFTANSQAVKKDFTGAFPEYIWDMTNLTAIKCIGISQSGQIPSDKVAQMQNLGNVTIVQCGLTGETPATFGQCAKLSNIDLHDNKLAGSIPAELGQCERLMFLNLSRNELTGSIPAELGKCTKLQSLEIADTKISGSVPAELGNTDLRTLDAKNTEVSGPIPAELSKCQYFHALKMANSKISGSIPPELGECKSLAWIDIENTQLTGSIPASLANCTKLSYFNALGTTLTLPAALQGMAQEKRWKLPQ